MPTYIFIVGLPRTGTKLMVNLLKAAPGYACVLTPENFFLGRAFLPGVKRQLPAFGDLQNDANVERLVEAMYSGHFYGEFWDRLQNGTLAVPRAALRQALLASDRSERSIYAALLQCHAPVGDQVILGDKTGPHLYHVPTLLQWFPEAKVIHTLRDPRAILASEHKKRTTQLQQRLAKARRQRQYGRVVGLRLLQPVAPLFIVLYITVAWLRAAHLHYRYQQRYPQNYYLAKFEDLVNAPVATVQALCRFLGIAFDPAMLNPPTVDSSFARTQERGFDAGALTRWQSVLKPWMAAWLWLWAGKALKKFGYGESSL